jgi:predicted membrane protein
MKSVVFEKSFSFVEFRDFCLLKSILELIIRSLVNIKRKEEIYFVDKIQKFKFTFAFQTTKSSFYSLLYSIRSQIILFYLNFLCCFSFLNLLNFIFISRFVFLFRRQHDHLKWTAKTRSKSVLFRSKFDLDHKRNEKNDVWTKIHDAAKMNRLLYTKTYSHEKNNWKDMNLNKERLFMKKISQKVQRF